MQLFQQLLFIGILIGAGLLVFRRAVIIWKTIKLGHDEILTDKPAKRLGTVLRIAFAQKKMFDRPLAGCLHFLVYTGFILINLEVLEIVLDGVLGTHRLLAPVLGRFYTWLIGFYEILAVGVIAACLLFLLRRQSGIVKRLSVERHRELSGWPSMDGRLILVFEIVLMIAVLVMNAADLVLQERGVDHYANTGDFLISSFLKPFLGGLRDGTLLAVERLAWWFHILGILAFALFITYSKHLHILLAFPNTYFSRLNPKGEMTNMPEITREVRLMLGLEENSVQEATVEIGRFGAKDVTDLSWKNLLDAYSCTECGRCTSVCPANITGKLLSPRKIMMDTRDRLEEVGRNIRANSGNFADDGRSLLGDYILDEEVLACTTCNACVQECPILINPLDIILQLRRYRVMDEAKAPGAWNMMFQNLETNQAPWKFSLADRYNWAESINNKE